MNGAGEDVLRLPAVLDLAAAEDFLGTVLQQLQASQSLCLDAREVETLTLPCVQIILAAIATHRVTVANPTEAFVSAFRDMALDWRTDSGALDEPAGVAPAPEPPIAAAPEPTRTPAPGAEAVAEPTPAPLLEPAPYLVPDPTPRPLLAPSTDAVPAQRQA